MKLDFESKILIAIVVVMCGLTIIFNIRQSQNEQHFSFLAQSFLNGKTYFLEMPGTWDDTVVFGDRNYRASGLLSALILVPGVWFWGINNWGLFSQAMIQIPAVIGIWILVWLVARRIGWGRREAVWAAVLFCWATVFSGVALWPWSWQFAQVLSVLLWWVILAWYTANQKPLILGVLLGLLYLTRSTASVGIVFFVLAYLYKRKWSKSLLVCLPYLIMVVVGGWYNQVRFGNFWESGQMWVRVDPILNEFRKNGEFSIVNVPRNAFYLMLGLPKLSTTSPYVKADVMGMGMFVTSPYMIFWLWKLRKNRDRLTKHMLLSVILITVPILMFFSTGFRQVGYRYSLDFLPLVYWWCLVKLKQGGFEISRTVKIVGVIWCMVNVYFLITVFYKFTT
jgi:hypothetical protein